VHRLFVERSFECPCVKKESAKRAIREEEDAVLQAPCHQKAIRVVRSPLSYHCTLHTIHCSDLLYIPHSRAQTVRRTFFECSCVKKEYPRRDSNPQPLVPKTNTLSIAPRRCLEWLLLDEHAPRMYIYPADRNGMFTECSSKRKKQKWKSRFDRLRFVSLNNLNLLNCCTQP
jgi:hypothetical protein